MADDVIRDVTPPRYPVPAGTRPEDRFNFQKVSWGAIWAGVMVTLGMEALFLSFGIFIGAALGGSTPWDIVWYLVTMSISFFVGAQTAARLSDVAVRDVCILHGLTTWGLATLATVILGGLVGWAALAKSATPLAALRIWGGTALMWGGVIWGGVTLSLCTAFAGGRSLPIVQAGAGGVSAAQGSPAPMRRVG